jgi:hypothetical protein
LLEELRDSKNYEEFQKDVANANIFIGSLIFIEELAEKVLLLLRARRCACVLAHFLLNFECCPRAQIVETVTPVRERLDACLVFPSMPAVMCALLMQCRLCSSGDRKASSHMHATGAQEAEQARHLQPEPAGQEQEPHRGVHAQRAQEQRQL